MILDCHFPFTAVDLSTVQGEVRVPFMANTFDNLNVKVQFFSKLHNNSAPLEKCGNKCACSVEN